MRKKKNGELGAHLLMWLRLGLNGLDILGVVVVQPILEASMAAMATALASVRLVAVAHLLVAARLVHHVHVLLLLLIGIVRVVIVMVLDEVRTAVLAKVPVLLIDVVGWTCLLLLGGGCVGNLLRWKWARVLRGEYLLRLRREHLRGRAGLGVMLRMAVPVT